MWRVLFLMVGIIFSVVGLTVATAGIQMQIQEDDSFRRYFRSKVILLGLALVGLGVILLWFWLTS